jgi:mannose-6-phosphate isomerase-like protein (cupin superfamily)
LSTTQDRRSVQQCPLAIARLHFLATVKASAEETGGRVAVILHSGPKDSGSPLHVHHRESEWFYVLDGELIVWVGGQVVRAPAGSFVFGPQGTPHTFTVSSGPTAASIAQMRVRRL